MEEKIFHYSREIAREAGKILLKGFRSEDTEISYKSRTDLVTNIDRESESYLFGKIKEEFPGHTIIAEEGSRQETEGEYVWYIDPIDATNNFAHGIPFFCISIGVFSRKQGRVISGVVFDPYHNEMFSAVRKGGTYLNDMRISVSSTDNIGISIVATGFPYDKGNREKNNLLQFNRVLPRVQGVRRIGSAALDLSYLSCGRTDGYWEPMLYPWDMTAGSLLVEEAGGRVTDYHGNPFNPEYPEIAASNGKIHEQLLELINGNISGNRFD